MHPRRRRRATIGIAASVVIAAGVLVGALITRGGGGQAPSGRGAGAALTVAAWRFAEGAGSETYDSTGDGHDGNLQAGVTWGAGAPGESPHSASFAQGSRVVVDTAPDLDFTGALTIDAWVQLRTGPGAGQTIVDKGTYGLRISRQGRLALEWAGRSLEGTTLNWMAGRWYHIIATNNGSTTAFFRDGRLDARVPSPGPTATDSLPLLIGAGFDGSIGYLALSAPAAARPPIVSTPHLSTSTASIGSAVTIDASVAGSWANPDDPAQVNVSASITMPNGATQIVPGFLYQPYTASGGSLSPSGTPDWQVRYTPQTEGRYSVVLRVVTPAGHASGPAATLTVAGKTPQWKGYVRPDPSNPDYYSWSAGSSFFGVGADLNFAEFTKFTCVPGSTNPNDQCLPTASPTRGALGDGTNHTPEGPSGPGLYAVYQEYMTAVADLAAAGANSGRLRLDTRFIPLELDPGYAGIPGYPRGVPDFAIGRYNAANAWIADQVVEGASHDSMALQLTSWNADQLPWGDQYAASHNAALVQRKLRYEVARWGSSTGVLGWEFFNELGSKKAGGMDSAFWQATISFLRSLDIDHHVVTNSYQGIDSDEIHAYVPASGTFRELLKMLGGRDAPHNVSEYGQDAFYKQPPGYDPEGSKAHEGEWSALFGGRSGAWYWWLSEHIAPDNLYQRVFHGIAAFTRGEDLGASTWHKVAVTVPGQGPAFGAHALSNGARALLWLQTPTGAATLKVHGLQPGRSYTVEWWDTVAGVSTTTGGSLLASANGTITLNVPAMASDVAAKIF